MDLDIDFLEVNKSEVNYQVVKTAVLKFLLDEGKLTKQQFEFCLRGNN
ncbi:MAG: hypothetical protein LBI03_03995 [Clostridiales bacterium]|jgi:hypothetical protein|nr:hypothetical protein [Clostridiales bacterium]